MATISITGADYVGYEYKEKIVNQSVAALYRSSYPCFGWEEVSNELQKDAVGYAGYVALSFRRDRKICNRTELTRLQRNFENCASVIEKLEQRKTAMPTGLALLNGMTGFGCLLGGIFLILAEKLFAWAVILIILGIIGCASAIFVYRVLFQRQMEKIAPFIEIQYDEICSLCEKGSRLLL